MDVALVRVEVEVGLVVEGRLFHLLPEAVEVAALTGLDEVGQDTRDTLADALDRGQAARGLQGVEVRTLQGKRPGRRRECLRSKPLLLVLPQQVADL